MDIGKYDGTNAGKINHSKCSSISIQLHRALHRRSKENSENNSNFHVVVVECRCGVRRHRRKTIPICTSTTRCAFCTIKMSFPNRNCRRCTSKRRLSGHVPTPASSSTAVDRSKFAKKIITSRRDRYSIGRRRRWPNCVAI